MPLKAALLAHGRWKTVLPMAQDKFDFGFAIDWMIKDLGFCLDEAERQGIQLPLTEKTNNAYMGCTARRRRTRPHGYVSIDESGS